jgi:hypothetical protein
VFSDRGYLNPSSKTVRHRQVFDKINPMSRTRKDSQGVTRRDRCDLEVVKREDGSFDFFRKGTLTCTGISERYLSEELGRFGYCGSEFYEILREVQEKGSKMIPL